MKHLNYFGLSNFTDDQIPEIMIVFGKLLLDSTWLHTKWCENSTWLHLIQNTTKSKYMNILAQPIFQPMFLSFRTHFCTLYSKNGYSQSNDFMKILKKHFLTSYSSLFFLLWTFSVYLYIYTSTHLIYRSICHCPLLTVVKTNQKLFSAVERCLYVR